MGTAARQRLRRGVPAYSPPKTENGYRWVEVPKALMDELRRWQTELRNVSVEGHDPVFPTRGGKPQSHANIWQRGWYLALKRAGVYDWKEKTDKHVRFRDLRRTAVSLMRDLGVTEGDISATTGHSIAVRRAVYSHPLPKEPRSGTDAITAALAREAKYGLLAGPASSDGVSPLPVLRCRRTMGVAMSPLEQIAKIEKCVVEADIAGMAHSLGELHVQWETLPDSVRSHVLKLDAILLTLLHARTRKGS